MRVLAAILPCLAIVAAAVGCGGGDSARDEGGGGPSSAETGSPLQRFEHLEGRLPDSFPDDFPVYEGVTIHRGDIIDKRFAIDLRVDAEMEDVVNYYRGALAVTPWAITADKPADDSVIFDFKVTDGRPYAGQVAVARLQDLTWVLIAMTFER